ncbi:MAG TPA: TIGR04283 family arsenosugar biosynthesis glycosyltransferase [Burkholderiales bacterium]|nr:TIGR04283 family arsenosugar biosynthesis glycosyltransferase [Burkholderiales bacterium]
MTVPLSIIIPTLNEVQGIERTLELLQSLRHRDVEVIVVDGGSRDGTYAKIGNRADRILRARQGRAHQMNSGAKAARGEVLLFLHADCSLPEDVDRVIAGELRHTRRSWGRFDVTLSGDRRLLRVIEHFMNMRSRLTGIATGDQGIFVRRELFAASGGFPEIELMEDIAFSRRLKRFGDPLCLRERIVTSSRRWETGGVVRTMLLMWCLRLAYFLGAKPAVLARLYEQAR